MMSRPKLNVKWQVTQTGGQSGLQPVADLGGDGGDASPPTSLKVTILAEKSALILNNSAPFRDASPPPTKT